MRLFPAAPRNPGAAGVVFLVTANDPSARKEDDMARDPDKFTRGSFSFRRMAGWQLWSISVVAVAVVAAGIVYAVG